MIRSQGITLIGVTLANLENAGAVQLSLPLDGLPASALDAALDNIRDRYGSTAITRAVLVGREEDLSVPLLPD
jgi:DNA polymerase-4